MKRILIVLSVVSICIVSCKNETKDAMEVDNAMATDSLATEEPEMAEEPMDSIAIQKAWEAYMTPSEAHKMMAAEEGSWTNAMTFWMDPEGQPQKATSTADIKMILGGRYQQTNYQGNLMGMPFEGVAMLAYDNTTEEFTSTWIDNMGTGMMVVKGKYDEATKTTTLTGTMVDPAMGKEKQVRETYTIVDENTRKMEMFEATKGGAERKTMEIVMTKN